MKKLSCHNIKILYYECSCRNHKEASNETLKMVIKIYKVMGRYYFRIFLDGSRGNTKKIPTKWLIKRKWNLNA
jgi:hypothetical protein